MSGKLMSGKLIIGKLREWHIKKLEIVQQMTGFTNYQILWIAFAEGIVIGLLLGWWLF